MRRATRAIGPNAMRTYMKLLNVSVGQRTKRSTVIFELEAGDKTRNASDYSIRSIDEISTLAFWLRSNGRFSLIEGL